MHYLGYVANWDSQEQIVGVDELVSSSFVLVHINSSLLFSQTGCYFKFSSNRQFGVFFWGRGVAF